ncbi:hypothetical protein MANES_01G163000v8 [Manihot esculenta]|uniref:Uncharacterized protein n=1 Tax=Manihot esculenta TaxID=3983 RepID=A0ACB7IFM0_MANES|nr:hypothetical protein MANES_01G163000v8 [Manihot esculenta]
MPSIAALNSSPYKDMVAVISEKPSEITPSNVQSTTPQKRKLRSNGPLVQETPVSLPVKRKSPRRCFYSSPTAPENEIEKDSCQQLEKTCNSPPKKLYDDFTDKPKLNPRDIVQMSAVKEALHVSTAPSVVVCREDEQKKIFDFCKACIQQEKAGSLYVCGCPGTGKSLSMEKVKQHLVDWAKESGLQSPEVLSLNCTSLTKTSEIFNKIMGKNIPKRRINGSASPLQHLQNFYSQQQQSSGSNMMLIIADELDYLITKDRGVLHDLFMLTTFPFSRCILIGIANAIDLADRFLPRLQSMNCKPMVVTFRAYSKDQILRILKERLMKVAAASGDMRKALCICRSAIEILEAELRESASNLNSSAVENELFHPQTAPACEFFKRLESSIVGIDHMAVALSKAYKSPIVDTIQSLPQHQQIILCAAVKFFRGGKKDTVLGELNKYYIDICKSTMIPPVGILEFLSMCQVLNDQGLLKLGQCRDDKMRRLTLKIDAADITFALQGVRFFRNCLQ